MAWTVLVCRHNNSHIILLVMLFIRKVFGLQIKSDELQFFVGHKYFVGVYKFFCVAL